jgi:hypothetical protein
MCYMKACRIPAISDADGCFRLVSESRLGGAACGYHMMRVEPFTGFGTPTLTPTQLNFISLPSLGICPVGYWSSQRFQRSSIIDHIIIPCGPQPRESTFPPLYTNCTVNRLMARVRCVITNLTAVFLNNPICCRHASVIHFSLVHKGYMRSWFVPPRFPLVPRRPPSAKTCHHDSQTASYP